jgi:hypothetical protein
MLIGDKRLIQFIAVAGLSFALTVGPHSASRAADDAAPAAAASDPAPKTVAKDDEPTTTNTKARRARLGLGISESARV